MADLPVELDAGLSARLARALDVEGKIPRALDALGPVGGRDVLVVDGADGIRARQLADLGARVTRVEASDPARLDAPAGSADALVGFWSTFRGAPAGEVEEARRVLRPRGRLLVVHDYGRDDVAVLLGDPPEPAAWSRRDGPFLGCGFRIRVVHCWWTFDTLDEMRTFLDDAFGPVGRSVGSRQTRARLSYKVAIYHRTFGEERA